MTRVKFIQTLLPLTEHLEAGNGFEALEPSADLVSVIVPSYNHEEFIAEALGSIIRQTYSEIEIILIDDGSTDGTFKTGREVLIQARRPFCLIKKENEGLVPNLNAGIQVAYGGWVCLLASDDIFYPEKLKIQVESGIREKADVVIGLSDEISRDGEIVHHGVFPVDLSKMKKTEELRKICLTHNYGFAHQGLLFSKSVFSKIGFYDPELYNEDYDLSIRLCLDNVHRVFISEALGAHRNTREVLNISFLERMKKSLIKVVRLRSKSIKEFRQGVSTAMINSGLNKIHYGFQVSGFVDIIKGISCSPFFAVKKMFLRLNSRIRRYKKGTT